jgi:hypothetical protein
MRQHHQQNAKTFGNVNRDDSLGHRGLLLPGS